MGPVGQRYAEGAVCAGHWIEDRRRWFHEPRKPLSANPGHHIRIGWLGWALGGFTYSDRPGAAPYAPGVAQLLEMRYTRAPRALGVGLGCQRGWGGLSEH
jgi:hypothetical protein